MSDAVIDLGEIEDEEQPATPMPARRFRPPLAAVALALLALLGGAAPRPPQAPPVTVPAISDARLQVLPDRFYVIDLGELVGTSERRQTIRAYTLPGVRPLFAHTLTVPGEIIRVQPAGDDLLLINVRAYSAAAQTTIAVRPGGPELWRHRGELVGVTPGGPAVFGSNSLEVDDLDREVDWHGVDLATGEVRWRVRKEPGERSVTDLRRGVLRRLHVLRAGRLSAYDTRDGRRTAQVRLPGLPPPATALWPVGDRVLISGDTTGTTIFDPGLIALAHTARSLGDSVAGSSCGDLICVYAPDGRVTGIDPATLTERWSRPDGAYSLWEDGWLIGMEQQDGTRPRIVRSDPVTGRVTDRADGWQFAAGHDSALYVERMESGGATFGVLEVDPFRVRPLATAAGVTGECTVAAEALVCRRSDAAVGVWRLR
ncbi:outer membrane protein assembly factor BamB family protein [Actinoplanes siamensis]|uniref:Uncharacterized protein n=1 Tax=Actinoplanes siamensis TaxID=1223317 RepID=A0A919N7K4_9ACTN|nr:PQQ-binding-like beta-propeller repeat protein [Actinoplanes siamensis]GIF05907.1 hypothetical protein Asi03nite_34450 [Actinoplanes siamensis]